MHFVLIASSLHSLEPRQLCGLSAGEFSIYTLDSVRFHLSSLTEPSAVCSVSGPPESLFVLKLEEEGGRRLAFDMEGVGEQTARKKMQNSGRSIFEIWKHTVNAL